MQTPQDPKEVISGNALNLSAATEKLVTTGSLNLSSAEEAESERRNREKDKELERELKTHSFLGKRYRCLFGGFNPNFVN